MSDKSFLDLFQKIQNKFIRAIKIKNRMENHESEMTIVNVLTRLKINVMKTFYRIKKKEHAI